MSDPVETRALLVTPSGTSAIAVVRVIGPRAREIVESIFHPCFQAAIVGNGSHTGQKPLPDRRGSVRGPLPYGRGSVGEDAARPRSATMFDGGAIRYGRLQSGGELIDDVLVSAVDRDSESSYDICLHGGVRILENTLRELERLGAKVINDRSHDINVWPASTQIEREVVDALVHARTERAVRFLCWQKANLVATLEHLAKQAASDVDCAYAELQTIGERFARARRLIAGATLALIGPPNSGKSTLFNKLVGRDAAVVSSRSGTTRDWVSAEVDWDGVPLTLLDTAGVHDQTGSLEFQAIEAGRSQARGADLCVLILDGSQPLDQQHRDWLRNAADNPSCILARNKSDIPAAWNLGNLSQELTSPDLPAVSISGQTGAGLSALLELVLEKLDLHRRGDYRPSAFTFRQHSDITQLARTGGISSERLHVAIKRLITG